MKRIIILLCAYCIHISILAQAPQSINYQAVARNAQGMIIPAQNVSIRFSIIDGTITGSALYQEIHNTVTNNYGLFSLAIGKGTPITGTFSGINWSSTTDKFLKVEIASSGGNNYDLQGITQLLSVPFALYAEKTKLVAGAGINITNGNTISSTAASYTGGTGINISGTTISGAYTAGNGINITGPVIAANYTGGTGINVAGSTISHNLQAGTGINITGSTISGAYQGGNGINITGNTIAANYTGGTGITVTGSTISHNLQAGTGINITGSTIGHNIVAGTGVNITGNIISAPGAANWL